MRYLLLFLLSGAVLVRFLLFTTTPLKEGQVTFSASLLDSPEYTTVQRLSLLHPSGQKVFITTEIYPRYSYGQNLDVSGKIERRKTSDGRDLFVMAFPKVKQATKQNPLYQIAGFIRERVRNAYQTSLPGDDASLLLGIVLGSKEGMTHDFEDDLATTGLMHVVAASGMNVTLLAGFVFSTLGRLLRRQMALLISIAIILLYAVLAGLEASIVRASLMASLAFTASLFGRQSQAFLTLLITALLMLLVSPQLLFDIGFQLSFAATLGIIVIKPKLPLKTKKDQLDKLGVVKEDVTTSLASQITTLPILVFYFHSFGVLSLLVNLLVLWTVAPLMIIGGLASIVSLFIPLLGSLIALLALPLTSFFIFVVHTFANLTPVITLENITWPMIIGYYVMIFSLFYFRWYAKASHH